MPKGSPFNAVGRAIARTLFVPANDRISQAINQFESIATELDSAVAENEQLNTADVEHIAELQAAIDQRNAANDRGRSVSAKLRALIS
ncbi:hypothetical protein [Anatilimnocola floriformis]|uniref:hypothetical protein n=1 Tax=Anatilimnocola floriformis TaxID=2948575 RepID=UPI0020C30974|nr:hypothetical protein [Anatilimnocola floriformis]